MALENTEVDVQEVVAGLLKQNAELRLEIATHAGMIKSLSKELELARQMKQSQTIPPDLAEMLSKLNIR